MSEKINLKDLTQLELLDLRQKVNDELDEYSNREKILTCTIKQKYEDTRYFMKCKNAYQALLELIDEQDVFDLDTQCCLTLLTVDQRKKLCEDLA